MMKRSLVLDAVAAVDRSEHPTSEAHMSDAIRTAIPEGTYYESLSEPDQAEILAFGFNGSEANLQDTDLGTYYGPRRIVAFDDAQVRSWPNASDVMPSMISYWENRAKQARHPVLRARYADLVWDLSRKVADRHPAIDFARLAIDANLEIASRGLDAFDGLVGNRLRRALVLGLSVSDAGRVAAAVDAIADYDSGAEKPDSRRPAGFAFEALLFDHKKLSIATDLRDRLLKAELDRFERYIGTGHMDPADAIGAERIAMRLVRFYRKVNEPEGVRRVLSRFGTAFVSAMDRASAIVASAQVQRLYELFHQNGMAEEARALEQKMRELGRASVDEMQAFTVDIELPVQELDAVVTWVGEKDLAHAVARFWSYFLPDRDHVQRSLEQQLRDTPLQYLISKTIVDRAGNPIAEVPSVDDDPSGRLVMETAQHISMETPILIRVADRLRANETFTLEEILDYLAQSPAFPEDAHLILTAGLNAYFAGDHIVAISVLIPQIELGIREIAIRTGASVFKPLRFKPLRGGGGGRIFRSLDDLLREPNVIDLFGESAAHYLRVLLTDQRGWNIRNTVCHGLADAHAFDAAVSHRVFHVLTLLAQLRVEQD